MLRVLIGYPRARPVPNFSQPPLHFGPFEGRWPTAGGGNTNNNAVFRHSYGQLKQIVHRLLQLSVHEGTAVAPSPSSISFGDLRQLRPISPNFGLDRGRPVDRYYIENFLAQH